MHVDREHHVNDDKRVEMSANYGDDSFPSDLDFQTN